MKKLISLLFLISMSLTVKAEDFNVLWEMDFPSLANHVHVSDEGKYFFYSDSGFVKFHDSETGNLINNIQEREFLLLGWQDYYLNDDRFLLPFSLDSILIYNIATQETEETINLGYNVEDANIRWVSLSPNKRYLTLACFFNEARHLIIIDLVEKRLYKDLVGITYFNQIYSTNDPNRMIVVTTDQHGSHLIEITIDGSQPFGYKRNIFENVDTEGEIRGQKYDADEDAFYYLYLPYSSNHILMKYNLQTTYKSELYKQDQMTNRKIWFNENNDILLYEVGVLHNYTTNSFLRLRSFNDNIQHVASSCNGFETILIREYTSLQDHELRRLDVNDFLMDVEIDNPINNYLYPNPTSSSLKIELGNEVLISSYKITDANGKQVLSGSLSPSSSISIDVESLLVGVYIIELTTSSGDVVTDKFVKE